MNIANLIPINSKKIIELYGSDSTIQDEWMRINPLSRYDFIDSPNEHYLNIFDGGLIDCCVLHINDNIESLPELIKVIVDHLEDNGVILAVERNCSLMTAIKKKIFSKGSLPFISEHVNLSEILASKNLDLIKKFYYQPSLFNSESDQFIYEHSRIICNRFGLEVDELNKLLSESVVKIFQKKNDQPHFLIHQVNMAPDFMDVRTKIPLGALATIPNLTVSSSDRSAVIPNVSSDDSPKILIIQRSMIKDLDSWTQSIRVLLKKGWLIISEWDDHPDLLSEEIRKNWSSSSWQTISMTHACQVSTLKLRNEFIKHVPDVAVFANALSNIEPLNLDIKNNRIVFAALNREGSNQWIYPAVQKIMMTYQSYDFVIVGNRELFSNFLSGGSVFKVKMNINDKLIDFFSFGDSRIKYIDKLSHEDYLGLLRTSEIGLMPLVGTHAELYKSDIKFVEMASRGVFCVASSNLYADTLAKDMGILVDSNEDWFASINKPIMDPDFRKRAVSNAYNYVANSRLISQCIESRLLWYKNLWNSKKCLDKKLSQRHPELFT